MGAAYTFQAPIGLPGDVTRTEPASTIEPCKNQFATPVTQPGAPVLLDPTTQSVRGLVASDSGVTSIYGIVKRDFPFQTDQAAAGTFGAQTFGPGNLIAGKPVGVIKKGYVAVAVCTANGAIPGKDSPVFIWIAASTGQHIQGGFESVASGGNTIQLNQGQTYYNGNVDTNGNAELAFNL